MKKKIDVIFNRNFNGSVDELLEHASANADLVDDVVSGKMDTEIDDEGILMMIRDEFPGISDQEAGDIMEYIKYQNAMEIINKLMEDGLIKEDGVDADGNVLYKTTELGTKVAKQLSEDGKI